MQIVALLIIVILFSLFAKPKNPKYYRIAVGSIFGIASFCLWLFIRYYAQIFEWSITYTNNALIVLSVFAALLCYLPFIHRINQLGSLILLAMFLVSVFITFTFEHEIKFYIAEISGYFDGKNPIIQTSSNNPSKRFEFKQGGYAVEIPQAWSQNQLNSSNTPYFSLRKNEKPLVEFRPKCLHHFKLALPEIILNLTKAAETQGQLQYEKQCFHWNQDYSACLFRSRKTGDSQATSRWRWFAVNPGLQHGIELDFVVYAVSPAISKDIENIIGSVEIIELPEPRPICFTPAEWM